jgi:hypothetical protein
MLEDLFSVFSKVLDKLCFVLKILIYRARDW